jgi:putative membrane protein
MFIQLLLSITVGILCGIVTGLIPGIHINLVSILLVSISPFLLSFTEPIVLAVFVIAMAVTHTFLDTIPSTFLGAPEAATALAVMPAHTLLLKGMGYEAVKLTVIGSLFCLLLGVFLVPLLAILFPIIYKTINPFIGWILLGVVIFMILKEMKLNKIFWNFFIFLMSGILGLVVLNWEILRQPLFPMLSGLFGMSILLISLNTNVSLPVQRVTEMIEVGKWETIKSIIAGTLSGGLTSLFPGLGAAQAAIIAGTFFRKITSNAYLILIGGITTVNFMLSIVTFYTLRKARNGGIIAVMEIIKEINLQEMVILLSAALIVGGIATILALNIAKVFSVLVNKIDYKKTCIGVISLITILVFVFSGPLGILILIVSTSVGLIPQLVGVGKNNAMGCLLLPVILYFLL